MAQVGVSAVSFGAIAFADRCLFRVSSSTSSLVFSLVRLLVGLELDASLVCGVKALLRAVATLS